MKAFKSLKDAGEAIGFHTSDARAGLLLAFITNYQSKHDGDTPTIGAMMRELGSPETVVRRLLARLEGLNKIHFISRNPMRIMIVMADTPECRNERRPDPARQDRFLEVEARRQQLARFIGDTEAKTGSGPTLRQMMAFLGTDNGSWTHRQASIMAERGIITFGDGRPTGLTDNGRILYGHKPKATTITPADTAPIVQEKVIVIDKRPRAKAAKRMSVKERGIMAGKFIARYELENHAAPMYSEVSVGIGLNTSNGSSIGNALNWLVENKYLHPRAKGTQRNLIFTERGIKRFVKPLVDRADMDKPSPDKDEVTIEQWRDLPASDPTPMPTIPSDGRTFGDFGNMGRTEWGPTTSPVTSGNLSNVATSELIMELVERGYMVRK